MGRKIGLGIVFMLVLALVLAGCNNPFSKEPENVAPEPNYDNLLNAYEHINEKPEDFYAPLTGMPVESELNQRIIGVMISNIKAARPQSGLLEADIVYEALAESEITRLVAFYQSKQPAVIGPVRSARPYYIDLITGYDGVVVHVGASQAAYAKLRNNNIAYIDDITKSAGAFWRVSWRNSPHSTYVSYENLLSAMKTFGYRTEGKFPELKFYDNAQVITGESAQHVKIKYFDSYVIDYMYEPILRQYHRSINGLAHLDLDTGKQLTAKNILVIRSTHRVLDSSGRRSIDVVGPGDGYLFQNGVAREITWKSVDGVIRAFVDGVEQPLYPGQTWVIIVQNNTVVNYQ